MADEKDDVVLHKDLRKVSQHGDSFHLSLEKSLVQKLKTPILVVTWKKKPNGDIEITARKPRKDEL